MGKLKKAQAKKRILLSNSLPGRARTTGAEPGTLRPPQMHLVEKVPNRIDLMCLGREKFVELAPKTIADIKAQLSEGFCWFNVVGVQDSNLIKELGPLFKISSLTLEDILTTDQRPKVEDHDHYLFVVARIFRVDSATATVKSEQLSLVLGENFLLSFQETEQNIFDPIKERVRRTQNRFDKWKGDYFLYSFLDTMVDHYFHLAEFLNEDASGLENHLLHNNDPQIIEKIYQKKMDVMFMRRYIWPLRECVSSLGKIDTALISPGLAPYLKDLYDHTIQASESIDSYKDMLSLLVDFSVSLSNHRINEVMKFLTIFASIFIPLTFIVGIYGMNFDHMPELKWRYGYHFIWGVMLSVTFSLLFYFRRKKWL